MRLFPASYSRINTCFTVAKHVGVWNCHATCGHRKTRNFKSIVYASVSFSLILTISRTLTSSSRQKHLERTMCRFSNTWGLSLIVSKWIFSLDVGFFLGGFAEHLWPRAEQGRQQVWCVFRGSVHAGQRRQWLPSGQPCVWERRGRLQEGTLRWTPTQFLFFSITHKQGVALRTSEYDLMHWFKTRKQNFKFHIYLNFI